jgi:hypothetical protein
LLSSRAATSSETPIQDRRAMLERWRQKNSTATVSSSVETETRKRIRGDAPPPLPPSSKQHRTTMSQESSASYSQYNNHGDSMIDHHSQSRQSTINYYDEETENRTYLSARTPSSRNGMGSAARRKSTALLGRSVASRPEGTSV